ncbi:diguanylate cyclase [Marinobacterium sp. AK62]|uniref:Diguanylate cyclase n=1 Tax=Marinobacterium alkalitolerans TaxID=1542925 RepID=A0ABS3Z8N4_9GAMM|nr:diguanylate cyclase [Marinobacterium alkalitolerans]MBP0048054.1 diguanylate cyclase [Marinobacterium alkalitolerans]
METEKPRFIASVQKMGKRGHSVITLALILLMLVASLLAWVLYRDYRHTLDSAGERLQTQLRAYASAVDIAFISADSTLSHAVQSLETRPDILAEQPAFRPLLLRSIMRSPELAGLRLFDRSGQLLTSAGVIGSPAQPAPPWVQQAMDNRTRAFMGFMQGYLASARLVVDARGKVQGALVATVEPEGIEAELERGDAYGNQHLFLVDQDNQARQVTGMGLSDDQSKLKQALAGLVELDAFRAFGTRLVEGERYLFAIRQLGQQPVRAIAAIKRSDVLASWKQLALSASGSLGLLSLVAMFFLKRWRDSLIRERKVANDLTHLYQAIEQIPSPIAITDLNCHILYVNAAYVSRSGWSRDELLGQKPAVLASGHTPEATYEALWASLERGEAWEGEFVNRMRNGSERIDKTLITPVHDIDGRAALYFAISSDVTEKREYEQRLLRYREIVNASDELMALVSSDYIHQQVNSGYLRYQGATREDVEGCSLKQVYGSQQFNDLIKPVLDQSLSGEPCIAEAWIDFAGKGRRFCRISSNPVRGDGHVVESLAVNLADLTARRHSEEALRASEARFRALADFAPIGIFESDASGRNTYANRYFEESLGLNHEQLSGEGWASLIHPEDRDAVFQSWMDVIGGQRNAWQCDTRMIGRDGEVRWFRCAARRYDGGDQAEAGYIGMVSDMTEQIEHQRILEQKNEQLERLSITDALTGLTNRGQVEKLLNSEVHRYERYGNGCSVIMLDIDHFKQVNDTCGHAVGDQVLRQIAALMRENTRLSDIPGRWGGEEFLILCPETDEKGAYQLAENLRQRIEAERFPVIGQRTCSFGVAAIEPGDQARELLKRADDALYRAKNNGRNQVVAG